MARAIFTRAGIAMYSVTINTFYVCSVSGNSPFFLYRFLFFSSLFLSSSSPVSCLSSCRFDRSYCPVSQCHLLALELIIALAISAYK